MPAANPTTPKSAHFVPERGVLQAFPADAPERIITWDELLEVRANHAAVWVDVWKLDAMLPRASNMRHVRFAGENGIGGKYAGVDAFLRRRPKEPVMMPEVRIEPANECHRAPIVFINNGRHRFAWMRDHGATALPVAALTSEATEVAQLVGTENRICRVTMCKIREFDWRRQPH
jgi:hypothetical protein